MASHQSQVQMCSASLLIESISCSIRILTVRKRTLKLNAQVTALISSWVDKPRIISITPEPRTNPPTLCKIETIFSHCLPRSRRNIKCIANTWRKNSTGTQCTIHSFVMYRKSYTCIIDQCDTSLGMALQSVAEKELESVMSESSWGFNVGIADGFGVGAGL